MVCVLLCLFWLSTARAQAGATPLRAASAIAYDAAGNLYIADSAAHRVYEATLAGTLVPFAGSGTQGFAGDGGPATAAELNQPQGIAVGPDGTVYIADTGNQRIRVVSAGGVITTFAGTGVAGFGGDGGLAVAALLHGPTALALDSSGGVLLLCDTANHRVRRVSAGIITTVAGSGTQGFAGDGGAATDAQLDSPAGVTVAADGRIFVSDTHNQRIRVITVAGSITTYAGTGAKGFAGDGEQALVATFSEPRGLALDSLGALVVADSGNERIRSISAAGIVSTLAGSGVEGNSSDGAQASAASARRPRSVALSALDIPVYADTAAGTVRALTGAAGLYQPAALTTGRVSQISSPADLALVYGQGSTEAAVTGSVGVPQGNLRAVEGAATLSAAALNDGKATVDLSSLSAGTHTLTLSYLGDGLNPAAAGGAFHVTIAPAAITATAASATVPYGAAPSALSGVLAGVLPRDANQVAAVYQVSAGDLPAVGTYPIVATISGVKSANYSVTMAPNSGNLQVVKANSLATLGSMGQAYTGVPTTITATVASTTRGQPTGTVQFLDGDTVISAATVQNGTATAVYTSPPIGTRQISVSYLGDANFLPSTSAPVAVSFLTTPDFVVAPGAIQSASTSAGGTAQYSISVSSQSAPFTGAVALSATGLPAGASVSFSPPQVVPGVSSAAVTVTVQMGSVQADARGRDPSRSQERLTVLACAGGLALVFRRRRLLFGTACALSTFLLLLAGCGTRTISEGTDGVLAQTYTLQVTGTATNLAGALVTHSIPLTLTVEQ